MHRAALTNGTRLGQDATETAGPRPTQATVTGAICEVLDENGYQPNASATCITLTNCPFHSLVQDYPQLVCGINLDLVVGYSMHSTGLCGRPTSIRHPVAVA